MVFIAAVCVALTSIPPELPGAEVYLAGRAAQRQGKYADALRSFSACAETDGPLTHYARIRAAECRVQGGDAEGGLAELRGLVENLPEGPWRRMAAAELASLLHDRKRHAEAAPLFSAAIDVKRQSPWMAPLRRAAAECFLSTPATAPEGFRLFAEILDAARLRRDRIDAARRLVLSPNLLHRLTAIEALIDGGEHREARIALVAAAAKAAGDLKARADYLEGRCLLAAGNVVEGRARLETLARERPDSEWARKGLAAVVRSLLTIMPRDPGLDVLEQLVRRYPDTPETGEVLFWYAGRLQQDKDAAQAVKAYLRTAETCPTYARADAALLAAADLLREQGNRNHAARIYEQLGDKYPRSASAPEAWFRAGGIHERSGHRDAAVRAFRNAASGDLGNFYAHRALGKLGLLAPEGPGLGAAVDVGVGGKSWLREKKITDGHRRTRQGIQGDAPGVERLAFFGANGLEEAEWEALYLGDLLDERDDAGPILQAISDAGLCVTAAGFARAMKWGEEDGRPTPDRLRIEFPRAYWPLVQAAARETGLDPYLLLAMARQESLFQARVVSSAGAVGVMQLMPGTAAWLAKVEPSLSKDHTDNLEIPLNSLRLGAHYLMRMLERNNGNLVFAAASYNAGPGNVDKWRVARPNVDMDTFIDAIPFTETRGFVKKILGNYAAYRSLYAGEEE